MTEPTTSEVIITSISSIGVICNLVALRILCSRSLGLRSSIRTLLMNLGGINLAYIIMSGIFFGVTSTSVYSYGPLLLPLLHVALTAATYSTVAVSVERWIVVTKGFLFRSHVVKKTILTFLVPIYVFSVLCQVAKFGELATDEEGRIVATVLRRNPHYMILSFLVVSFVLTYLIPMLILVVFNIKLVLFMRQMAPLTAIQRRDRKVATALFSVVALMAVTHSVRNVINMIEWSSNFNHTNPPRAWIMFIIDVSHIALVINASFSLLMYMTVDIRVRSELLSALTCRDVTAVNEEEESKEDEHREQETEVEMNNLEETQ